LIKDFVQKHPHSKAFTSLGQLLYLSCIQYVDGVVGNSSSGLTEAPTFKKGTVNIGDRQRGRIKADSVIDCKPDQQSITKAIKKLNSPDFKNSIETVVNPYGTGGASDSIIKILEDISLDGILKKEFYDLEFK
jgi:GDP/UDP-N,N'-diacetylbacillosamine 2-epimerase (hydrolysing)